MLTELTTDDKTKPSTTHHPCSLNSPLVTKQNKTLHLQLSLLTKLATGDKTKQNPPPPTIPAHHSDSPIFSRLPEALGLAAVAQVSSRRICLSSSLLDSQRSQWNVDTLCVDRSSTSMLARCQAAPKPAHWKPSGQNTGAGQGVMATRVRN